MQDSRSSRERANRRDQDPSAVELMRLMKKAIDREDIRPGPYTFTFKSSTKKWSAPLFSMSCLGQECSRRCSRTIPYCAEHLETEYQVELKQTSLRDPTRKRYTFLGIFAVGPPDQLVFRKGEPIMPYLGEVSRNPNWLLERYGSQTVPYGFAHSGRPYFTDSALLRGAAASINSATPERKNNVEFRNTMPLAMIYALSDIYEGDELLISYGEAYRFNEPGVTFSTK